MPGQRSYDRQVLRQAETRSGSVGVSHRRSCSPIAHARQTIMRQERTRQRTAGPVITRPGPPAPFSHRCVVLRHLGLWAMCPHSSHPHTATSSATRDSPYRTSARAIKDRTTLRLAEDLASNVSYSETVARMSTNDLRMSSIMSRLVDMPLSAPGPAMALVM